MSAERYDPPDHAMDLEASQAKVEALTKEFLAKVMEHCGTAQVFITSDSDNGRWNRAYYQGKGNWYARFGVVQEWCNTQKFEDEISGDAM